MIEEIVECDILNYENLYVKCYDYLNLISIIMRVNMLIRIEGVIG